LPKEVQEPKWLEQVELIALGEPDETGDEGN